MQEIETKFYVRNLKQVETRIQGLGARLIQPRVFETNLRFDRPDGRLRSKGQVLRLRQDTEARLTFKDRGVMEEGVRNRTEIEFTVDRFGEARMFLEALGYQKVLQYDKYRTTYELQTSEVFEDLGGPIHIMLDELPYGNFVEIEGEDSETIHEVANKLSLDMQTAINVSYATLFERVKQSMRLMLSDLTFENFELLNVAPEYLQVEPTDH